MDRSCWCVQNTDPDGSLSFTFYIWILPPDGGLNRINFSIDRYPENVSYYETTANNAGCSVYFSQWRRLDYPVNFAYGSNCIEGWRWILRQRVVLAGTDMSSIRMSSVVIQRCDNGKNEYATPLTRLCLNYDSDSPYCTGLESDESSWGGGQGYL